MEDSLLLLTLIGYLVGAFLAIRFTNRRIVGKPPYRQLLIRAFLYALFFGFGFIVYIGNTADPGFAMIAPNLLAMIFMVLVNDEVFGMIVLPVGTLLFWWLVIYLAMRILYTLGFIEDPQPAENSVTSGGHATGGAPTD